MNVNKIYLLLIFIVAVFYSSVPLFPQQTETDGLKFQWIILIKRAGGGINEIDLKKRIIELDPEDKFRIFLKPIQNAYIYLFLLDAQDQLFLLFPQSPFFNNDYSWGKSYFIPGSENWFWIDQNQGVEKFHLLVSTERLAELETLAHIFFKLISNAVSSHKVDEAQQNVLDEIRNILKQKSNFTDSVEKPVSIAGEIRGVKTEEEIYAFEIYADDFYARTIRIKH